MSFKLVSCYKSSTMKISARLCMAHKKKQCPIIQVELRYESLLASRDDVNGHHSVDNRIHSHTVVLSSSQKTTVNSTDRIAALTPHSHMSQTMFFKARSTEFNSRSRKKTDVLITVILKQNRNWIHQLV